MKHIATTLLLTIIIVVGYPSAALAGKEVTTFEVPEVRSKFCSKEIPAAFCQCAFSELGCDVMKMGQEQAYGFVQSEYKKWVSGLIAAEAQQCLNTDGFWNKSTRQCIRCTEGDVRSGTKCVAPGTEVPDEVGRQCRALKEFSTDWRAKSDFVETVPGNEASLEVQEYNRALNELTEKIAAANVLEYEMEIDRQVRLDIREYKTALVDSRNDGITSGIFRLAWVTYNTPVGAEGIGGSYRTLVQPDTATEVLLPGLEAVQTAVPAESILLQFDTAGSMEKIKLAAWNATLEVLGNAGNPASLAAEAVKNARNTVPVTPELVEGDMEALRAEHLENLQLDKALAESYAENAAQRKQLFMLEVEIADLYNQMESWREKEYTRAYSNVQSSCNQ